MKQILYILIVPLIATITSYIQCSGTNIAGGGTIETTNGIVGSVCDENGSPSINSIVRIFPENYDPVADTAPGASFVDTTDKNGAYRFNRITAGTYVVLARCEDATLSMMIRGVAVTNDSITTVPEEKLDRSGTITAVFPAGSIAAGSYLYIPGTDIAAPIGNEGLVLLADVPAGTVSSVILVSGENTKRNVLRNDIAVAAGDTVFIERPQWNCSRRLILNSSFTGANVAGDVYEFPVLVRLSGDNFNFSQARSDGGDLLFTGSGNVTLSHEIERWDAAARLAEVWVQVDTVYGNDSTQSITMFWGNPGAIAQSPNGGVFDIADGYQGVWHLGDGAGDSIRDATSNRYSGGSPDTARPFVSEGIIGKCRSFDGDDDYITMPNTAGGKLDFAAEGQYAVSAWVALDSLDEVPHLVVAKGYEQYFVRFTYFPSGTPLWEFSEYSEAGAWQACTSAVLGKEWALITGVSRGSMHLLYCNGVLVDSMPNNYLSGTMSANTTSEDLSIGAFLKAINVPGNESASRCFFKGSIDEVRIVSAARNRDWVRLCYMNQRIDDRLVVFR